MQPRTWCLCSKRKSSHLTALQAGTGESFFDLKSQCIKALEKQDQIGYALLQQEQHASTPGDVDAKIRRTMVELRKQGKLLSAYMKLTTSEGANQLLQERQELMKQLCDAAAKLPPPAASLADLVGQLQQLAAQLEQLFTGVQTTAIPSARAPMDPATPQQQQQQHTPAAHAAHPHASTADSATSMQRVSAHCCYKIYDAQCSCCCSCCCCFQVEKLPEM